MVRYDETLNPRKPEESQRGKFFKNLAEGNSGISVEGIVKVVEPVLDRFGRKSLKLLLVRLDLIKVVFSLSH